MVKQLVVDSVKCLCRMSELWLKSFVVMEEETSHSQPSRIAEEFNALPKGMLNNEKFQSP